jgi:hypothetical protein
MFFFPVSLLLKWIAASAPTGGVESDIGSDFGKIRSVAADSAGGKITNTGAKQQKRAGGKCPQPALSMG